MSDWEQTTSPQVHWYSQISAANYQHVYKTLRLEKATLESYTNISYGLPTAEAIRVCKQKYRQDVAKLTIQITDPNVMQIKQDVRVTFADQLAVIGTDKMTTIQAYWVIISYTFLRRHFGTVCWGESHQSGGGGLLDL